MTCFEKTQNESFSRKFLAIARDVCSNNLSLPMYPIAAIHGYPPRGAGAPLMILSPTRGRPHCPRFGRRLDPRLVETGLSESPPEEQQTFRKFHTC